LLPIYALSSPNRHASNSATSATLILLIAKIAYAILLASLVQSHLAYTHTRTHVRAYTHTQDYNIIIKLLYHIKYTYSSDLTKFKAF